MQLQLKDVLPLLRTISRQQIEISEKLADLIQTFKVEPEPVEPTLRVLLDPLKRPISEMSQTLEQKGSRGAFDTSDGKA